MPKAIATRDDLQGRRAVCYILTVDRSMKTIHGRLGNSEPIVIYVVNSMMGLTFRWPKQGEWWIIEYQNSIWHLAGRYEDTFSGMPLADLPYDTARIDAADVKTRDNKDVVAVPSPSNGDVPVFNQATSTWEPGQPSSQAKARAYASVDVAVPGLTYYAVPLDKTDYDTDSIHPDTSSHMTIKTEGIYEVTGGAVWAADTTGSVRACFLRKNGSVELSRSLSPFQSETVLPYCRAIATDFFAVGDYIELVLYQDVSPLASLTAKANTTGIFGGVDRNSLQLELTRISG